VVTAVVCAFIWSSRIYTNRVVLRDIPKDYVPIEAGDVPRKVRKMIEKQWRRSAVVAWDSRPRDVTDELVDEQDSSTHRRHLFRHKKHSKDTTIIPPRTAIHSWGQIEHPGWSVSPDATATNGQNVHYWAVIVELPNLLEAKAVSLAPPLANGINGQEQPPDPQLVALLQRPVGMGLRDYVTYLIEIGALASSFKIQDFIDAYEHARFSTRALPKVQFDKLMASFAFVLSLMALDGDKLSAFVEDNISEENSMLRYTVDLEDDRTTSFGRPSLESDMSGLVRRNTPLRDLDSLSLQSHSSSIIIHPPRLSSSDT